MRDMAPLLGLLLLVLCSQQALATLDIPAQLIPNRLTESNSFWGKFLPVPHIFTGPAYGTAKEIKLACLETKAPHPYPAGYQMRCPDTAKIYEWYDKYGAYHRRNEHAPIPGVTAKMIKWLLSPDVIVLSPLIPCMGKIEYWYKCWHPLDHITVIPFPGLSADSPKLPGIFLRVWEHYRKRSNETVPEFEVNMPLSADPASNFRFELPFLIPGAAPAMVIGAFNQFTEDTPKGVRVITEFIVGSDAPLNPLNPLINLFAVPVIHNQLHGLADQISRHSIEEFGNLEYFLPETYYHYHPVERHLHG